MKTSKQNVSIYSRDIVRTVCNFISPVAARPEGGNNDITSKLMYE